MLLSSIKDSIFSGLYFKSITSNIYDLDPYRFKLKGKYLYNITNSDNKLLLLKNDVSALSESYNIVNTINEKLYVIDIFDFDVINDSTLLFLTRKGLSIYKNGKLSKLNCKQLEKNLYNRISTNEDGCYIYSFGSISISEKKPILYFDYTTNEVSEIGKLNISPGMNVLTISKEKKYADAFNKTFVYTDPLDNKIYFIYKEHNKGKFKESNFILKSDVSASKAKFDEFGFKYFKKPTYALLDSIGFLDEKTPKIESLKLINDTLLAILSSKLSSSNNSYHLLEYYSFNSKTNNFKKLENELKFSFMEYSFNSMIGKESLITKDNFLSSIIFNNYLSNDKFLVVPTDLPCDTCFNKKRNKYSPCFSSTKRAGVVVYKYSTNL